MRECGTSFRGNLVRLAPWVPELQLRVVDTAAPGEGFRHEGAGWRLSYVGNEVACMGGIRDA
jgi:hypothetical protein